MEQWNSLLSLVDFTQVATRSRKALPQKTPYPTWVKDMLPPTGE